MSSVFVPKKIVDRLGPNLGRSHEASISVVMSNRKWVTRFSSKVRYHTHTQW